MMEKGENIVTENFEIQSEKSQLINVIPVIEEEVIIGKKVVETGRILVKKTVSTEDVTVEVPVLTEHFDIERVSINQYLDNPPAPLRYEGDTIVIPVLKEVVVKRILLVEEIHLIKKVETSNKTENISVRKEEVTIERNEK